MQDRRRLQMHDLILISGGAEDIWSDVIGPRRSATTPRAELHRVIQYKGQMNGVACQDIGAEDPSRKPERPKTGRRGPRRSKTPQAGVTIY